MTNRGLREYSLTTSVGQLRLNIGDTNFTEFDPGEADFVNFDYFSDQSLESLIETADENITRATGYAYRVLAGILTMSAVNIQTDDLRISTTERAKMMAELAKSWLASADDEDAAAASDLFEVIPFGGYESPYTKTWPEATMRPVIL